MKVKTKDTLISTGMILSIIVLALFIMANSASKARAQEKSWAEYVGSIAHQAYMWDDVGDTFDVGLLAAKVCGVEK